MLYGREHESGRKTALKQLKGFHERKPELFTIQFLVYCWARIWFEHTEAVRGGVLTLIRILPLGANRDALTMLPLTPHKKTQQRIWRRPNVFSSKSKTGMRKGRTLHELGEKIESARISGSPQLRNNANPGPTPPSTETPLIPLGKRRPMKPRNITGGGSNLPAPAPLPLKTPQRHPLTRATRRERGSGIPNPKRPRLTRPGAGKRENRYDGTSIPTSDARPYRGRECETGLRKLMKKNGLRWTMLAQIVRRGGAKGTKLLNAAEIDGYIHSIRESDEQDQQDKEKEPHTGGYHTEAVTPSQLPLFNNPPGLQIPQMVDLISENAASFGQIPSFADSPTRINSFIGSYPPELDYDDLTLPEDNLRTMMFGADFWFMTEPPDFSPLDAPDDVLSFNRAVGRFLGPNLMGVPSDLHSPLLNWIDAHCAITTSEVEPLLASSIRNILARGSSNLRQLSAATLAKFRSLDRFHAGDGGICRITWGPTIQLDDWSRQTIAIGELHFSAVDYGDVISLNEAMQQRLTAIDKDERSQRTLLSVAA